VAHDPLDKKKINGRRACVCVSHCNVVSDAFLGTLAELLGIIVWFPRPRACDVGLSVPYCNTYRTCVKAVLKHMQTIVSNFEGQY